MSLDDLLLKADIAIWKGFEKVTHYCHDHFGYTKWDLAKRADQASMLSLSIMGVYIGAANYQSGNLPAQIFGIAAGVGLNIFSGLSLLGSNDRYHKKEEEETQKIIRTGCQPLPDYSPLRSGAAFLSNLFVGTAIYLVNNPTLIDNVPKDNNHFEKIVSLSISAYLLATDFMIASNYFRDQTSPPPKKEDVPLDNAVLES